MDTDDLSDYLLTSSQLSREANGGGTPGASALTSPSGSQFTFSGNLSLMSSLPSSLSLSPSPVTVSSPTPLTVPLSPLGENPYEGWGTTPPECVCDCPKRAYVVFHGRKTGIFTLW